jgi:hypothetical protein
MSFVIPLDFDDSRTRIARLIAEPSTPLPTLYVVPVDSVLGDEWDAFDKNGRPLGTYSTWELTRIKGRGLQTVRYRFSDAPWSFLDEKPRKKRTRRGGRKRKPGAQARGTRAPQESAGRR